MTIPFIDLSRQYKNLQQEILEVTNSVYTSGKVLDGEYTNFFERAIAKRCERRYAIAVNSCTQGLTMATRCIIPESHKVLIPAVSFAATINSVLMANCTPVFCDTDDQALINLESLDFNMQTADVQTIMYANLFGNVVDWDRFLMVTDFFNNSDSEISIIEDAAQSFGASYRGIPSGKLGHISVLSFDPTKNLPNYGSGGMILTDDLTMAEMLYDARDNGKHELHQFPGTNSKMSEVDCAQMLIKLSYFNSWQERRQKIAEYYTERLENYVETPRHSPDVVHAWHKYVIRLSERHGLHNFLMSQEIETKIHYAKTLLELPLGWEHVTHMADFTHSMAFTRECLSLPIYPELTDSEVETVVDHIINYLS